MVAYHRQAGLAPEAAEAAALIDLRREMINQLPFAQTNNRRQNEARQAARTQAFNGLMAAFLFVVVLVGTTYMSQSLSGVRVHGEAAFQHGEAGAGDGRFVEKPAATSAQSRTVSKTAAKPHLEAPRTVIKGSWGWVPKDASNDHSDGKKA